MNRTDPAHYDNAEVEILALIATLHETEQRLAMLTAGEVDAVVDPDGRTILLSHSQEQLRYSEASRQAAILNALPVQIALLDRQGVVVSVNEDWVHIARANAMTGPECGVGVNYLHVCDHVGSDSCFKACQVASNIESVLSGASGRYAIEYSCDALWSPRWFLMTVTPLAQDCASGAVVMQTDITERKVAEEAMRLSELRFHTLFECAPDGIIISDGADMVIDANTRMCQMLGCTHDEVVVPNGSKGLTDKEMAHLGRATELIKGQTEHLKVWRLPRKDGSTFDAETIASTLPDGKRMGIVRDVTERKRSEVRLAEVQRELVEASRRAGMEEVATTVLHNVGNVLNSVNVSVSLVANLASCSRADAVSRVAALLREHHADLGSYITTDPKGRHVPACLQQLADESLAQQQSILKELNSLRAHIDHIKVIVTTQQGLAKASGVSEEVFVSDLVEDSLLMNQGALARHDMVVVREFDDVPPIIVEKHKALQVLTNLISNAKQACENLGTAPKCLKLRIAHSGNRVQISVSDNGAGIPPENLVKIFTHGFTTRKAGHGFGLHSSALAAIEMGGSLTAHSDGVGRGATFTLDLPRSRQPPRAQGGASPLEAPTKPEARSS